MGGASDSTGYVQPLLLKSLLTTLQQFSCCNNLTVITYIYIHLIMSKYSNCTLSELKLLLAGRGVKKTGRKQELVEGYVCSIHLFINNNNNQSVIISESSF